MTAVRDMMAALKLMVNETKTHVRQVPAEKFDFLGYTFGLHWTHRTKRKLLCGAPSKQRIARVCKRVSAITDQRSSDLDRTEVVIELNRVLHGWAGDFCLGPISDTYRAINAHVRFDERDVETEHGAAREAPATERAGKQIGLS